MAQNPYKKAILHDFGVQVGFKSEGYRGLLPRVWGLGFRPFFFLLNVRGPIDIDPSPNFQSNNILM